MIYICWSNRAGPGRRCHLVAEDFLADFLQFCIGKDETDIPYYM
jgi:hypothetical protein